jgi:putative metalloenzyme radical SAM/SPASM domain maturase
MHKEQCPVNDVKETITADGKTSLSRSHPSKLFVEVTTRCNLRCGMCMKQNGSAAIPEGSMSVETFSALGPAFPYLEALILNGVGEPLLHPHLEDFIRTAKKSMPSGAWVGFQSNGMLLNHERASSLVDAGLDRICLSVDAVSDESFRAIREGGEMGGMESAFEALNSARRDRHLEIGIEFVVRRDNLGQLPSTLRWAADRGTAFAIVTQLLPYDKALVSEAAYDTNTAGAVSVYEKWRDRAKAEGVDIRRYLEVFMKFTRTDEDLTILLLVGQMKNDARSRGIALHLERLLRRDDEWFNKVDLVFEEARQVAAESGIDLRLPGTSPQNSRKCDFVEGKGAFISWDGNVHPCYFLWHRYDCHAGGWQKHVKPWVLGNLNERDIIGIWNDKRYRAFREGVLRYDFPFCFDCGFALCDYVETADFEQDCHVSAVPCSACLWCTGLFHCFQ